MGVLEFRTAPFAAFLLAIILAVIQLGCLSMEISSDWDRAVDFSKLSSYDWIPEPEPSGPGNNDSLSRDRVHRAVDRILAAKGYVKQTSGTPDFLVGYLGAVESKLDVRSIDEHYGYRPGFSGTSSRNYVREYNQGTLILDISDPHNSKLMWRGSARTEITRMETPQEREAIINEAVALILERFPPSSSK